MPKQVKNVDKYSLDTEWGVFMRKPVERPPKADAVGMAFVGTNKRNAPRHKFSAEVRVWLENGVQLEGRAHDVSERGVCLDCINSLPVGSAVRVELLCRDGVRIFSVKAYGSVVRVGEGRFAVAFDEMDDSQRCALQEMIAEWAGT